MMRKVGLLLLLLPSKIKFYSHFFLFYFQQFVNGTFENSYYPTAKKETHYPSVIHHDHKYNLKIVDIPDIPFFPVSSFYNISDLKGMYVIIIRILVIGNLLSSVQHK